GGIRNGLRERVVAREARIRQRTKRCRGGKHRRQVGIPMSSRIFGPDAAAGPVDLGASRSISQDEFARSLDDDRARRETLRGGEVDLRRSETIDGQRVHSNAEQNENQKKSEQEDQDQLEAGHE